MVDELKVGKILSAFPQATYDKMLDELKVPYTFNNVRLLHWLGVDVHGWEYGSHRYSPPKIEGIYPMYPHQHEGLAKMTTWGCCFNLSEPRTGKTATCIGGTDLLRKENEIKSTLIVTPLSTIYSVWQDEIKGMLPDASIGILYSIKHTLKEKAKYFRSLMKKRLDYYIINPAGLKNPDFVKILEMAQKGLFFKCIIADESSEFGNQSTKAWKALNVAKASVPYLWLLTGTPGGATTVHGQARLINPDKLPSNKQIWKMRTMTEVRERVWEHKPCAVAMIREVLSPALRYTRAKVYKDMVKNVTFFRHVPLDTKASKLYNTLMEDSIVEVKSALANGILEPANAGVMVSKLCQISSGTVKIGDEVLRLNIDLKIADTVQLIKEAEGKVIIVVHNIETIKYIRDTLSRLKYKVVSMSGAVKGKKRGDIFREFMNNPEGGDIMVSQHSPIKFGVELASASTMIFWGVPMMKAGDYKQVKDRLSSGKQLYKPVTYLLYSTPLERRMFKRLEDGIDWETNLVDFFNI